MASAQAAVSPVAQPSRPKSVSRPKRWSEEVEEGNINVYIYLNSNVADLTPVVINTYPCFFFTSLPISDRWL